MTLQSDVIHAYQINQNSLKRLKDHTLVLDYNNINFRDIIINWSNNNYNILGTIEYIRDGTTFRVTLPGMHRVYVRISGAEAPGFPKDVTPSPVAVEAKAYVERFLLHRDVNVTIRSPGGIIFAFQYF